MSFPRYDNYRDSGVESLGRIPRHWDIARLKYLLREPLAYGANEAADDDDPTQPRFVRITDIDSNGNLRHETFRSLPKSLAQSYLLFDGDVLLARSGATVGKSFIYRNAWGECCFAGYLIRARPNKSRLDPSFFYAACQSDFYWQHVVGEQIQSTIQNVSAERYAGLVLPHPPLAEQRVIAAFLDRETAKIDALVEEQKLLIELLKEKRQAVISHAVTKGLDPDAPMKHSGVEWLGELPAHWTVRPLKAIVQSGSSISYGIVQPGLPEEDGIPFVQTTNMSSGSFSLDDLQKTSKAIAASYPRSFLNGGEVLLGIRASIGAAHVAPAHLRGANLSRGVARIECGCTIIPEFLVSYLRGSPALNYWQLTKQGSTFNEVSIATVRELAVAIPPTGEQKEIIHFVETKAKELNALILEAEAGIALLQERRSALISAAVTGKIDVRCLVPLKAEAA